MNNYNALSNIFNNSKLDTMRVLYYITADIIIKISLLCFIYYFLKLLLSDSGKFV